jgi:hypothetical protein
VNQRYAMFPSKMPVEMELFGPEWTLPQVRRCIHVMSAQPQRCTKDDCVQSSRTGVHKQMAAPCRLHNTMEVPRVYLMNRQGWVILKKAARTSRIPITTGHLVPLTDKQFREQGTRRTDSKNKDPHGVATLA